MYELFVLGQLMDGDKHGYLLQERLKNAVGPVRQISAGTLYPLLSRMTEREWIAVRSEDATEGGRVKKLYSLTESGRRRFHELMACPLEHTLDTQLVFHFKLAFFDYATTDARLECLRQYRAFAEYNLSYIDSQIALMAKKELPEQKRECILRMLDHRRAVAKTDLWWVKEEIGKFRQ